MNVQLIKNSINYCISNLIYLKCCILKHPNNTSEHTQKNKIVLRTTFQDDVAKKIIHAVLQKREEFDVPSIQISILSKDHGNFNYVCGDANIETNSFASLDTVYYLGSISKIYVQAVILKLVQDDLISLDHSVSKYINISSHENVTIKHLLDHTSGLYDPLLNKLHLSKLYFFGKKSTTDEILRKVREKKPYFAPGEERKYSNSGYVLLGLIAEQVKNKSFSNILKEYFLDNYNLSNTFYSAQDNLPNRLATGYDLDKYHLKKGLKANIDQFPLFLPTLSFTSGGIVSNALDVSMFLYKVFNTDSLTDISKRKLRLFFSLKKYRNEVFRVNIGHMCGYNNFSGYSNSKKVSIVVLTNLTDTTRKICIPEKVAEEVIKILADKEIL